MQKRTFFPTLRLSNGLGKKRYDETAALWAMIYIAEGTKRSGG